MSIVLGAIADDFTGATDLANNLVRSGMRCVQVIGVPNKCTMVEDADAVVVALKSRSCPRDEAVSSSLAALGWLRTQGAKQFYFKYCSTFDSTAEGNIGPVADALMEELGTDQTVLVPAFPENQRTVYQGHLFVGNRLLSESGMENHPLNPMRDPDLVRFFSLQTPFAVGLLPHQVIATGADATLHHVQQMRSQGTRHLICDSIDDQDLATLADVVVDFPLVTGGSGLGQRLPAAYRERGWLAPQQDAARLLPATGRSLILSGSCSKATMGQVRHFLQRFPGFALDPIRLAEDDQHLTEALQFIRQEFSSQPDAQMPVMVYASAEPADVRAVQRRLGAQEAGRLVERALASLARTLVDEGVGRLVVAGGETSGAVVSALGVKLLRIGPQIDPGVPWTQTISSGADHTLSLALKSGNFGDIDFFTRAFQELP